MVVFLTTAVERLVSIAASSLVLMISNVQREAGEEVIVNGLMVVINKLRWSSFQPLPLTA